MPEGRLLRVDDVRVFAAQAGSMGVIIGMELYLEDGRAFTMYNIPLDVALTLEALRGERDYPARKSVFDFLANYEPFKEALARNLRRVVINEIDKSTGLYTATAEFEDDGFRTSIKMIPSHAVFLAVLSDAPIYVDERLVELDSMGEGEEE
ncbi:bifunctional nuclease family protein [Stetteria hydrogenophila]